LRRNGEKLRDGGVEAELRGVGVEALGHGWLGGVVLEVVLEALADVRAMTLGVVDLVLQPGGRLIVHAPKPRVRGFPRDAPLLMRPRA
jgi:hypothetical protein